MPHSRMLARILPLIFAIDAFKLLMVVSLDLLTIFRQMGSTAIPTSLLFFTLSLIMAKLLTIIAPLDVEPIYYPVCLQIYKYFVFILDHPAGEGPIRYPPYVCMYVCLYVCIYVCDENQLCQFFQNRLLQFF